MSTIGLADHVGDTREAGIAVVGFTVGR